VLLQKPRCKIETLNDLASEVVNFFRVLRDQEKELIRKIDLTPWSREEYELHREPCDDPIEKARRFWVGCTMAMGALPFTTSGMRMTLQSSPGKTGAMTELTADHLYAVARRLKGVQIENLDALEAIRRYDREGGLIYFDPPYPRSTRTSHHSYPCEVDDHFHVEAARLLHTCKSMVVVSGSNCPLYEGIYGDWRRVSTESRTNTPTGVRIESLWLSRDWQPKQLSLF